jgi:hypothetical protein
MTVSLHAIDSDYTATASNMPTKYDARCRIASNIAKLPELLD